jgi:hypothetical protein
MRLVLLLMVLVGCSNSGPFDLVCDELNVPNIHRCYNDELVCYMNKSTTWQVINCSKR